MRCGVTSDFGAIFLTIGGVVVFSVISFETAGNLVTPLWELLP